MDSNVQCRLCAQFKNVNEVLLFDTNEIVNFDLFRNIEECLNINFSGNLLPKNVCLLCCDQVSLWCKFRDQVVQAQFNLINETIKEEIEIKIEEIVDTTRDYGIEDIQNKDETLKDNDFSQEEFKSKYVDPEKAPETPEFTDFTQQEKLFVDSSTGEIKMKRKRQKRVEVIEEVKTNPERAKAFAERSAYQKMVQEAWKAYKWKCCGCEVIFDTVELLQTHFSKIHNEAPKYSCMECKNIFESYYNFRRHVANHRNQSKYRCDICGANFAKAVNFKLHKETHSTERNHMCSYCGKTFKTASTLRGHSKTHLKPKTPTEPQFQCDICQKLLSSEPSLKRHRKSHQGIKDITCELCGKSYAATSSLQYHIQVTHSETEPPECKICYKKFKHPDILKEHFKLHTTEKKFECQICGQRFHRKTKLKIHLLIHTGDKPHHCRYCLKQFRLKDGLRVHERQHTQERPYECSECGQTFANCGNLGKHKRARHGILTQNDLHKLNLKEDNQEYIGL